MLNLSREKSSNSARLICGIDEAGRGPVLGPLVLCGVCFKDSDVNLLTKIGVKDSKKLISQKREELALILEEKCVSYKLIIISVKEIDEREVKRITLNRLEELKMAEIINELKPDIIYIDAADVNEDRFGRSINKLLEYKPKKIISKHKADDIYPIVSAASIIAKHRRDSIINQYKKEYGEIGSGYTSDSVTIQFLKDYIIKHKKAPPFARNSWETTQKIITEEVLTRKITDFFT